MLKEFVHACRETVWRFSICSETLATLAQKRSWCWVGVREPYHKIWRIPLSKRPQPDHHNGRPLPGAVFFLHDSVIHHWSVFVFYFSFRSIRLALSFYRSSRCYPNTRFFNVLAFPGWLMLLEWGLIMLLFLQTSIGRTGGVLATSPVMYPDTIFYTRRIHAPNANNPSINGLSIPCCM